MLALCLMLLVTYYALNYAGIIGLGLILPLNEMTTRLFNNPVASSKFHEYYMVFSPPRFDLTYLLCTLTDTCVFYI